MLSLWRIVKKKHASQAFSGEGAKLYGGRWNREGAAVVYVSASLSLAALETFVHIEKTELHFEFVYIEITVPNGIKIQQIQTEHLKKIDDIQQYGSHWAKTNESLLLCVPSFIIPTENNYLINPLHPDFVNINIKSPLPFSFDERILKTKR